MRVGSSNTSPPTTTRSWTGSGVTSTISLVRLLRDSLVHLRQDSPRAYAAMCRSIPGAVVLHVDTESLLISTKDGQLRVASGRSPAPVSLTTSKQVILALLDGEVNLLTVIRDDRLELRGTIANLARYDIAFRAYLHGAIRSPAFPGLLMAYRGASS